MTTDIYGPVPSGTCGIIRFSVDYNFVLPWEGNGNMESADECGIGTCAGDPTMPQAGSCDVCWDFLWVRFMVDGVEVGGDLIGDAGTTNAEQSGTISFDYCASGTPSNVSIEVYTQSWTTDEVITFSNVAIECVDNPAPIPGFPNRCELANLLALPTNIVGIMGNWSGSGVSGNIFDPSIGPGTYSLTFTPNPGTCASPASTTITVTPATTPNLPVPPPFCETQANIPLNTAVPPGGITGNWSGPGVTGNTFDPDAPTAGPGNHTLTFTPNPGQCANTADVMVTVNPAQDITLTSATGPFCDTDPAVPLTINPGVAGTWSGPGVSGSTFNPGSANIGSNNITFTPSGGACLTAVSYNFSIEVQSGTPVTLDPVGPVCILDGPLLLSPTQSGLSGTWSGDGMSGNSFNPAVAGTGNTTLTFTPSGGGSCTAPATTSVTVQAEQAYTPLPPPGSPFCESSPVPVLLTTAFNGVSGSWNGPGVSGGNTFTPSAAGTGTLTLTFDPAPGVCANSETVVVQVQPEQIPVLDNLGGPYCPSDGILPLPDSQSGITGTWSGTGVVGGNFDPAQANAGNNTLTFTPNPGVCAAAATTSVTVNAGPTPNPPGGPILVCIESIFPPLWTDNLTDIINQINGGTGQTITWYLDAAGTNEIDPATYIPTVIASGATQTIYATVTDGSGCESATVPVTVTFEFTPDANPIPPITECEVPGGTIDLTAYDNQISPGNTVNWYQDAGATNPVANPSAYPAVNGGSVWATASGGLCESDPVQVTFNLTTQPVINPIAPVTTCGSYTLPPISGSNLSGGAAYYSSPNGTGTSFNPGQSVTASGTYYAYDSAAPGCEDEVAFQVTITPAPDIFPSASPVTSCGPYTLPAITGTGLSGNQAYYTGFNGTGQQFAPGSLITTSGILFLYDGTPGCDDQETLEVIIEAPPTVFPVSDVLACDSYTLPPIQGTGIGSNAFYYTGPNATGNILTPGQAVTSSQLLYVYAGTPGCFDETSFLVTIVSGIDITPLPDQSACASYTFPPINGSNLTTSAAYFTGSNGSGNSYAPGDVVTTGGTYYIFDDNTICSDEVSFELTITDEPVLSCGEDTPASGLGNADGIGSVGITGGAAPFQVAWSGPASGNLSTSDVDVLIVNLPQGAYSVTVTDDNGCSATCTFTISAPDCALNFDFDVQGATCPNASDGAAALTVTGGDGNYTYNWSSMAMGSSIVGVLPGAYTVTVTDGAGCQAESAVTIDTLNPAPQLSVMPAADTICENSCATVDLSFTGTPPFELSYAVRSGTDTLSFDLFSTTSDTTVVFCPSDSLTDIQDLVWQFGAISDAVCTDTLALQDTIVVQPTVRDTLAETLCPGETLTINGTVYDAGNLMGADTLTAAAVTGCDSIVVVMIDFFPADTNFVIQTLCTGSSLTVNGTVYDEGNPGGFEVVPNGTVNGCDSLISISLSFEDAVVNDIMETLCPGESLTVNGTLYDATNPSGADTLLNGAVSGCDSIINVMLDFFPTDTNFIAQTLCTGSSLMVNGTLYDEANPSGFEVVPNGTVNGCDSLISIALSFEDAVVNAISETLCPGESLTVNGTLYDANNLSGSDTIVNGSVNGCDSIINVSISYLVVDTNFVAETLCPGEALQLNGTTYDATNPAGTEVLPGGAGNGCDSVIVVDLAFFPADTNFIVQTLCTGDALTINGTVYDEGNPSGFEVVPNSTVNGCDSLISISLSFEDAVVNDIMETLCPGESLTVNGTLYDATNPSGADTLLNGAVSGCDSIINVMLDFFPTDTNFIAQTLCTGSSLMVNGTLYDEGNPSGFEVVPNGTVNGCDSLISVALSFEDAVVNAISETLCPGESLTVNGTLYDATNLSGSDTIVNGSVNGCDSIINVSISYNLIDTNFVAETLCFGESLILNGTVYGAGNLSGVELLPGAAANGCDSLISVNVEVLDQAVAVFEPTLCPGESLAVNGVVYDELNPTGQDTLFGAAVNGCDSIFQINLSFDTLGTNTIMQTLCPGETLTVNGTVYDEGNPSGSELLPGASSNGCDSVIIIALTYLQADTNQIAPVLCPGESLTINGTLYDAANPTGFEIIAGGSENGCDSLIRIDLTFEAPVTGTLSPTLCPGGSVTVGGTVYDATNPAGTEVLPGAAGNGCDSVVNVMLSFFAADTAQFIQTLCAGESLTVNGTVYDASNPTGVEVLPNAAINGCDSLVLVDLTFEETAEGTLALSLCEGASVEVNGMVYDETNPSGTELLPGAAENGCDSLVVIDLTFQPTVTAELSAPGSVCPGDSLVLTINLTGADSFDFNLNDDNGLVEAFTGAGNTVTVTVAPTVTMSYSLSNLSGTGNFCLPILPEPLTIEVAQIGAVLAATSDYNGFEVSCADAADGGVEVVASGGTPPYAYQWSNGAASPALSNLAAGTYTVTVNDTGGCASEASIELAAPSGILLEAAAVDANCLQENSGQIIIDTILGGLAPYQYQLNDAAPVSIGMLPVSQSNLAAGTYELLLTDANGCQVSQSLLISPAEPLFVELGENETIRLGESVQLSIDGQNFDIAGFTWQPDTLSSLEPVVTPEETTTYQLTAQDAAGCTATDFITVIVEKGRNVYAPNVFSPNGDGRNDYFTLFAGPDVVGLNSFQIYDRWGEQVFVGGTPALNNELSGWDGSHRGEPMDPGVFVFYAEVEFIDGHVEMIKGDFVLMR
ncbi:MAG: gliding motility-associated C-terminal domain-containing protein [bacterium]|nr:gliding motility-associated C-terminal domain-containing protein [bacterium]